MPVSFGPDQLLHTAASTVAFGPDQLVHLPPPPVGDTTPPVLSGLTIANIGQTSAAVGWFTDEPADTQVEYGLSPSYGSSTTLNAALSTVHGAPLTGLLPGTTYHVRARSRDAADNLGTATTTFQTASVPYVPPPPQPSGVLVEIAFTTRPTQAPVWEDVSAHVMALAVKRGRARAFEAVAAGVATVALDNRDRRFDPSHAGGPYFGTIKPRRRIRVGVTRASGTYWLFHGYIDPDGWSRQRPPGRPFESYVAVKASDAFAVLGGAEMRGTYPEQRSDERIAAVLGDIGWATGQAWILGDPAHSILGVSTILGPAGEMELDRGMSTIQAGTPTGFALAHLHDVERSEAGLFFHSKEGRLTFHGRQRRLMAGNNPVAVFGDRPQEGELPYVEVRTSDFDPEQLANDVRVQREGGVEQVAEDTDSQLDHFRMTMRVQTLTTTDSASSSMATYLLSRFKDPRLRMTGLVLDPHYSPFVGDPDAVFRQLFARELGDVVTVRIRPPGGGDVLEQVSIIEGMQVAWDAESNLWRGEWSLSATDPDAGTWWVLGQSLLGVSTRLSP